MEINTMDWGQKSLINELTQGKELLNQLQDQLDPSSSSTSELLITKLLYSFDKSLSMLNRVKVDVGHQLTQPTAVITTESPRSVSGSLSSDYDFDVKDKSKKRKILPKWTQQVRGSIGSGLEGPLDDDYSWRKYGSKDIQGAKHPRGYFRCTYQKAQGCSAIKHVQRSDRDPTIFSVTYQGRHTCVQASHLISGYSSNRQNQDQKHKKSQETYMNFQTGCEVKKEDLDNKELFRYSSFSFTSTSPINISVKEKQIFSSLTPDDNHFMGRFSPPDISPTTSESNYFSPYGMDNFGGQNLQTSEPDFNEIDSASRLASSSPVLDFDLDFSFDFDSHFLFDSCGISS